VAELYVDGLPADRIALKDDGKTHNVHVVMGQAEAPATPRAASAAR
ncbi:MAG: hypothetical protein JO294_01470, partial [Alphaproteobacteria bacterium]|nr:hypothetical protein [Alphaproteobacteria bacterium]